MTLIEILILQVGPAIAKAILKLWLQPTNTVVDLGADFVDLLKGRTSDIIAQQKAKRQFEVIGENVALSLVPIFEIEGQQLDEGGKSAVAFAFAKTLNKAKIDATILAKKNLEPAELSDYLIEVKNRSVIQLSEIEAALYLRIVQESSRLIVDIASQLPSFSERTFSEVLKREDQLISITNTILEEVRRIRESSHDAEEDIMRFETEYCLSVTRNLDKLELLGVDVSRPSKRHQLSVAYVTLMVKPKSSSPEVEVIGQQL